MFFIPAYIFNKHFPKKNENKKKVGWQITSYHLFSDLSLLVVGWFQPNVEKYVRSIGSSPLNGGVATN